MKIVAKKLKFKYIENHNKYLAGDSLGKFTSYIGKVNVPCKRCHNLVKVGINERLLICPVCNTKWG